MAKKQQQSTPDAPVAPVVPLFPGISPETAALAGALVEVTIQGGGLVGSWLVPGPIPQALDHGAHRYDLADRAAGLYTWRHR